MAFSVGTLEATIRADENPFNRSMRNVRRTGDRTSSAIESQFRRLGTRLAQAVAVAIPAIGGLAVRQAAEFERLRVSLDVLNRSAAEGARNFERLVQFSSQTPFQLQELTRAQNMLQGFGLSADDAFESLQNIGDIAAVSSGDIQGIGIAFGQAAAEGRLMTRDIRQLINQGVPAINLLANTMGVARNEVFDLASQGEISFEILQQAFRDATSEGGQFEDGMLRAQQTLSGAFSNLRDNTNIFLASLGELISDTVELETNTRRVSDRFADLAGNMETTRNVAEGVKTAFSVLFEELNASVLGDVATGVAFLNRKLGEFFATATGASGIAEVVQFMEELGASRRFVDELSEGFQRLIDSSRGMVDIDERLNGIVSRTQDLANKNETLSFTTEDVLGNYNEFKNSLDRVTESASDVIDITDRLNQQLSNQDAQIDIVANTPDPGTLADLNAQLEFYRENLLPKTSTAEEYARVNNEMEKLRDRISQIKGETENVTPEFNRFGREAAQVFDRLIFQGERFDSILKSILRQLATRQIAKFIGSAIGVGSGGFLGGILGSVGVGSVAPQATASSRSVTLNVQGELVGQGDTLKAVIDGVSTDLERLT